METAEGSSFTFGNVQPRRPRAKPRPQEEWESHKERIRSLWLDQGLPIERIIDIMQSEDNFTASRAQYNHQISVKWQLRKNLNDNDFNYIESKKRKRGDQPTRVKFNGVLVPEENLRRKKQRKNVPVLQAKLRERELLNNPDKNVPQTPPDLEVGTPSPSPSIDAGPSTYRPPDVMSITTSISSLSIGDNEESCISLEDDDMIPISSGETERAMSIVHSQGSDSLVSLPISDITTTSQRDVLFKLFCELKTFYHELPSFTLDKIFREIKVQILQVPPHITMTPDVWTTSQIREMSMPPTIPSAESSYERGLERTSAVFLADTILNKLQTLMMRLSNKVDDLFVQWDLVDDLLDSELLRSNVYTLKVFLNYRNPMIRDFAIQLFYSAARFGNLEILDLVSSQILEKIVESEQISSIKVTGLQFAILHEQKIAASHLADRISNLKARSLIFGDEPFTLLHCAVLVEDEMMLAKLLEAKVRDYCSVDFFDVSGYTFRYVHERLVRRGYKWAQKVYDKWKGIRWPTHVSTNGSASIYALILGNEALIQRVSPFDGKKGCYRHSYHVEEVALWTMVIGKRHHMQALLYTFGLDGRLTSWICPSRQLSIVEMALMNANDEILMFLLQKGADLSQIHPSILQHVEIHRPAQIKSDASLTMALNQMKSKYPDPKSIPNLMSTKAFEILFDFRTWNTKSIISTFDGLATFCRADDTMMSLLPGLRTCLLVAGSLTRSLQFNIWISRGDRRAPEVDFGVFFRCHTAKDTSNLLSVLRSTKNMSKYVTTTHSDSLAVQFYNISTNLTALENYLRQQTNVFKLEEPSESNSYEVADNINSESYKRFFSKTQVSLHGIDDFAAKLLAHWNRYWNAQRWHQKLGLMEAAFANCPDRKTLLTLKAVLEELIEKALRSRAQSPLSRLLKTALRFNQCQGVEKILARLRELDEHILLDISWYGDMKTFITVQQKLGFGTAWSTTNLNATYLALVAVYKGQLLKLAKLMEEGAINVNYTFDGDDTLLKVAARLGRMDIAKFLILNGATQNSRGDIAEEAMKFGHAALAEMVLASTTEEDRLSLSLASMSIKSTSLSLSSKSSQTKANRWLLGRFVESIDSNLRPNVSSWSAIKGFIKGHGIDLKGKKQAKSVEKLLRSTQPSQEAMSLSSGRGTDVNDFYEEMEMMADPEFSFV